MNSKEFSQFVSYLRKEYQVFTPQEEDNQVIIKELPKNKKTTLTNRLPFYSWKKFFVPEEEILFDYHGEKLAAPSPASLCEALRTSQSHPPKENKIALLGVNILDLRAILLYDLIFANDPYYQERRRNILIIGYSFSVDMPDKSERKIEEKDLAHLPFDIFLHNCHPDPPTGGEGSHQRDSSPATQNDKNTLLNIFIATEKGKKVLDEINYKKYTEVKFLGHKYNDFLEEKKNLRRDKLKNNHNQKIWDELGKICIECGKCTIACPTCFCFRIDDSPSLESNCGTRQRCWDSCYYQEFSEVAGGYKFLTATAQKIHFWYFHKFARIPDEYNMMGCVGCGRCHAVCPVGIDIKKVMEEIENS